MICGFSKHGSGRGSKPIGYLIAETVMVSWAPLQYLTGDKGKTGKRRDPMPVILRGDPSKTRALIDSLDFKNKYKSGVLSFAPGEKIPPETETQIMTEFEQTAFAGIKPGNYDILWVRHTHAGHHELHFVTPRVELTTGKFLNIAPPGKGSRELFDTFRSKINLEFGLADPDDPARARALRLPSTVARFKASELRAGHYWNQDVREVITAKIQEQFHQGRIITREDTLKHLRSEGFEIKRVGKDYITVENDSIGKRVRLRGNLYSERPSLGAEPSTPASRANLAQLKEQLKRQTEIRAAYNRKRYGSPEPAKETIRDLEDLKALGLDRGTSEVNYDRTRESSYSGLERIGERILGARAGTEQRCLALEQTIRRVRGATHKLERGIVGTRDAREHLVTAVDQGFSFREEIPNPADSQILQKYRRSPVMPSRTNRNREAEFEMERDR
ncbi:MAG: relaxase/mobilization nuclease domain-containing protein [Verrucomicrobia bacterium]|nr:relaxase/mobilization nuclease domain-containing protein [Verrucomicrobiota bacterium]